MSEADLGRLLVLLARDGWSCQELRPKDEIVWWKLSHDFPRSRRRIEVLAATASGSVLFQLALGLRPTGGCRAALESFLLRLNGRIRLARFSIDRSGQVLLESELLVASVSAPLLRDHLDALRATFAHYHREIELLAKDRALAEIWHRCHAGEMEEEPDVDILSAPEEQGAARQPA